MPNDKRMSRKEREAFRHSVILHMGDDKFMRDAWNFIREHEELLRRVREFLKECPACKGRSVIKPRKPNPIAAFLEWDKCPTCAALREYVREDANVENG